jgi:hemoglobin
MTRTVIETPNFSPTSTRARVGPGVAAGVTEEMIADLVDAFYAAVREDPVLGPVFEAAIGDGWEAHLAKLRDFWSSVLLMTGRFKGQPMAVHAGLPEIDRAHFARWLDLFEETAASVCPAPAASLFVSKARIIGESLQAGIAIARGCPVVPA